MIYFIGSKGRIKIGVANDPESRLKELQTGSHEKLRILAIEYTNDEDYKRESELHREFAEYRMRYNSEFFYPSENLVDYINSISDKYIKYDRMRDEIYIYKKMSK